MLREQGDGLRGVASTSWVEIRKTRKTSLPESHRQDVSGPNDPARFTGGCGRTC